MLRDFCLAHASPLSSLTEKVSIVVTDIHKKIQQWKIQVKRPN